MRKIYAIAVISVRNAVRSRVVASLLVMLALVIIGLPLTVKSDGTIGGHVQVVLTYALGGVGLLLSIATLWAACAAVSQEVAERQIHLVVTKPVWRTQVWLGKWLGLLAMNVFLLVVSGVTVYGLLKWTTSRAGLSEDGVRQLNEEILVARHVVHPKLADVGDQARALLAERVAAEALPEGLSEEDALDLIEKTLLTQAYAATPSERLHWNFRLPPGTRTDRPIQVRFKLASSALAAELVPGRWIVGPTEFEEVFTYREESAPVGFHTFTVPRDALGDGRDMVVTYVNEADLEITVVFPPEDGMTVLTHAGSFEMNLARSLLIILFHLAFLAALGVSAGSMFSMPVAALFAAYTMVLLKSAPYIQSMASRGAFYGRVGEAQAPSLLDTATGAFFKVMNAVLGPLQTPNPLEALGVGQLVPWSWVAGAFAVKVLLYTTVVAALGALVLNRRELGLPS